MTVVTARTERDKGYLDYVRNFTFNTTNETDSAYIF